MRNVLQQARLDRPDEMQQLAALEEVISEKAGENLNLEFRGAVPLPCGINACDNMSKFRRHA